MVDSIINYQLFYTLKMCPQKTKLNQEFKKCKKRNIKYDTYCTKRKRKDIVFGSCLELATAETPLCKSRTGNSNDVDEC